jgi:hypothetical protein
MEKGSNGKYNFLVIHLAEGVIERLVDVNFVWEQLEEMKEDYPEYIPVVCIKDPDTARPGEW